MRETAVALFFAFGILLTPIRAYGQAYAEVTESETLNSSGHLAVQIDCYAYGDWFDPYNDVDDYEDYAGVSIGSTQLHAQESIYTTAVLKTGRIAEKHTFELRNRRRKSLSYIQKALSPDRQKGSK